MFEDIRTLVDGIIRTGRITKEFEVDGVVFTLTTLNAAETILANSINGIKELRELYDEDKMESYDGAFLSIRAVILASFYITKMNDIEIHSPDDTPEEKAKKAKEFRKILLQLPNGTLNKIFKAQQELAEEQEKMYKEPEEILGK